jgi:hypothetical protein
MVSRAWCFGFGSGWGRQTCFSFALRRSKRWLPVFTNRKYSSSVRRTRGYLGLGLCYYHWRSRRFSQFSTSTPTSTSAIRTDLESFFDRSNFHTHTRTYYGHLRGTTQSSRLNEIQPSIIAFNNDTKLPRHWVDDLIIDSICYQLTSPATPKQSAQVVIICQISVTVPRNSYERLPADQKI